MKVASGANEALHIPLLLTRLITISRTGWWARHGGHGGRFAILVTEGLEEFPCLGALLNETGAGLEVEMIRYAEVGVQLTLSVVELRT